MINYLLELETILFSSSYSQVNKKNVTVSCLLILLSGENNSSKQVGALWLLNIYLSRNGERFVTFCELNPIIASALPQTMNFKSITNIAL